jgi:hypothetical protein
VPDDPEGVRREDDVYALPAQVCRLVEAIRPAAARALDADDALDDCALRRRPAAGQIQAGGLARLDLPEAKYPDRNSDGERSAAGGPGDLEPGHCDPADLVSKNASVERLQADTSIPPSGEEKRRAESGRAPVAKQQANGARTTAPATSAPGARMTSANARPMQSAPARMCGAGRSGDRLTGRRPS